MIGFSTRKCSVCLKNKEKFLTNLKTEGSKNTVLANLVK